LNGDPERCAPQDPGRRVPVAVQVAVLDELCLQVQWLGDEPTRLPLAAAVLEEYGALGQFVKVRRTKVLRKHCRQLIVVLTNGMMIGAGDAFLRRPLRTVPARTPSVILFENSDRRRRFGTNPCAD
jgi:hypothetical protein